MSRPPAVQPLVLVVEDEPQMRRLLVSALATVGYRSLHVETTVKTLSQIVGHEPDLVLLDVSQPGVDGVGVTAQLREWTEAPILVLTARERERQRGELLDAGANDYIARPFTTGDPPRARASLAPARRALAQARAVGGRCSAAAPPDRSRAPADPRGRPRGSPDSARGPAAPGAGVEPVEGDVREAAHRSRVGRQGAPQAQYLRAQVRHLRQKIEGDPARPRHLLTDAAGGYRLKLS